MQQFTKDSEGLPLRESETNRNLTGIQPGACHMGGELLTTEGAAEGPLGKSNEVLKWSQKVVSGKSKCNTSLEECTPNMRLYRLTKPAD